MYYITTRNNGFSNFRREVDRLFDDFLSTPTSTAGNELNSTWAPKADIDEGEDHYLLSLEIPGLKKNDLKIEVLENQVVISGERKTEENRGKTGNLYSERHFGRFQRTFALPTHVDSAKIEAQYQDGVLNLYIPKSQAIKPRQIKIGDSSSEGFFSRILGKKEEERNSVNSKSSENVA
jgi:HSP20 family protein